MPLVTTEQKAEPTKQSGHRRREKLVVPAMK
jgi:hypothetical protein